MPNRLSHPGLLCFAWCGIALSGHAQSVSDYAVRVSATVQTNPPQIMLSWPADPHATGYSVYRKLRDDTAWGTGIPLATNATAYVDTNVMVGGAYEYGVFKDAGSYYGEGYIYAGILNPLVESRGKVVLVVDNTFTTSLATELARLQQDLVADGWTVLRHEVARMAVDPANPGSNVWAARSNELANVKGLIKADYNADPANVKAVFLVGHVRVPYSGNLAPDGHADHVGAWPADVYYGDMGGIWTDSSVNNSTGSDPRTRNVPGDGKFDNTSLPSNVELQVGRVDFANMPAFPQSETELLRQYLNKDHNFRNNLLTVQRRGLVSDNLGLAGGEVPAVNGWRNFAPMFSASNSLTGGWLSTLASNSYLWGYACGGGAYTNEAGVANAAGFVTNDTRVVFTMHFGSYFGDWDSQNNLLRAQLGTTNYTLTSVWASRPNWMFHHMALGETIGFSTRLTQNNSGLYDGNVFVNYAHVALMGDPTLRMHVVGPPSALAITGNDSGGVNLSWNPSTDGVLGYHVYRAPTSAGRFARLTANLVTGTNYTDSFGSSNVYLVRAVKLEVSGSGSYYNPSQGIFQSPDGTAGAANIVLRQPTNSSLFIAPANITLQASLFDPANDVTNVAFYANGLKLEDATGLSLIAMWSNAPAGDYALTARAASSSGVTVSSAPVGVRVGGTAPGLMLANPSPGICILSGVGIPNYSYTIQSVLQLGATNWQNMGAASADASGAFRFTNSAGALQQFFRTVYP